MDTCKHKRQVLCTSLTLGSDGQEKAEWNQGRKASSQITSIFTHRGTWKLQEKGHPNTFNFLKEEWEWSHESILPIVWFQASSGSHLSSTLEELHPNHWDSFHWIWIFIPIPTAADAEVWVWFIKDGRLGVIWPRLQGLNPFSILHHHWNKNITWKMLPLTCFHIFSGMAHTLLTDGAYLI